jgi:hypothetical protein
MNTSSRRHNMVATTATDENQTSPSASRGTRKDHTHTSSNELSVVREVQREPRRQSATILAVGASVPLGLACAALATTLLGNQERVAVAAWVAVAVVGSASVISAAAVSNRRTVSVERDRKLEE